MDLEGNEQKVVSQESHNMNNIDSANHFVDLMNSSAVDSNSAAEKKSNYKKNSIRFPIESSIIEASSNVNYIEGISLMPKIADKKNGKFMGIISVLKRISFYVKNIVFCNEWISRTSILAQIYAIDRMESSGEDPSNFAVKRGIYSEIESEEKSI